MTISKSEEPGLEAIKRLSGAIAVQPSGSHSACDFAEVCEDLSRRFCQARSAADNHIGRPKVFCEGAINISCDCIDAWEELNLEVQAESGLCLGCPGSLSENLKRAFSIADMRSGAFEVKHATDAVEDPWRIEP